MDLTTTVGKDKVEGVRYNLLVEGGPVHWSVTSSRCGPTLDPCEPRTEVTYNFVKEKKY